MRGLVVAALAVLAASIPSAAQISSPTVGRSPDQSCTVHGTISGNMTNLTVQLVSQETGRTFNANMGSEPNGYQFDNVPPGNYMLVVDSGVDHNEEPVTISTRDEELDISLKRPVNQTNKQDNPNVVSARELRVPEAAAKALQKAQQALAKSKMGEAQEKVEKALRIDPQFPEALAFQAVLKLGENNPSAALPLANQAAKLDPELPFIQFVRSSVLNALGNFNDAKQAALAGLRYEPDSWRGHIEMAKAFDGLGQPQAALQEANRAEQKAPKEFQDIHLLRAYLLAKVGNLAEAQQELKLYPENSTDARATRLRDFIADRETVAASTTPSGQPTDRR